MKTKLPTVQILCNIAKCTLVLYVLYYSLGSLVFAIYRLEVFDGSLPFDFKTWVHFSQCCDYTDKQLVNLISMLATFTLSGAIYGLFIDRWLWDYAITMTLIHLGLSCLVMLSFPLSWTYWVCLAISLVLMMLIGEIICTARWYRDRSRLVVPTLSDTSEEASQKKAER